MRAVSDTYNPYRPVRHVGIGIKFGVMDQTAKPGASISGHAVGALDRLAQTIDDVEDASGKYASLEPGLWALDGSYDNLPDSLDNIQTGWWSAVFSGGDGNFSDPPWIRYDFAGPVSTIGWTLYFDAKTNQYPTAVRVTVYGSDGSEVAVQEFAGNSAVLYMPYQLADYYGVQFTFLSTSEPYRRVRLLETDFGLSEVMDANTIGTATLTYGVDILSDSIPSRQLDFTFDNSDKKYNLLDPDGIYEYLQEGQRIEANLTVDGEKVFMGSFYFTSATADSNALVPRIQANDVIWALDSEVFRGGGNTEMTLESAVLQVIDRSDVKVRFGPGVAGRPVVLAIGREVSRREALRLLAQAAMCTVWVDRDEVVNFADLALAPEPVDEITADELHDFGGITVTENTEVVEIVVMNPFLLDADGKVLDEVVYTAGEGRRIVSVENPCVAPSAGNAVAAWYLSHMQRRKLYSVRDRGNPAREIGDTVRIHDIFDNRGLAVVTDLKIKFQQGISCTTGGVGI